MNYLDVYYRALIEYYSQTKQNRDCFNFTTSVIESPSKEENISVKMSTCIIDEDWVNEIEKGLEFIEKALKEERQFIRSNGEVIPIEKVKHVSRSSVEHLAKHSNLITRYTDGEDVVPDELYTVEKLSDYAVYENRFLYMVLCYLRDFVTIRFNKILEITNEYKGELFYEKEVVMPKRRLLLKYVLNEEIKDDEYLKTHNPAQAIIDKISLILKSVLSFLKHPIMEEVAKTPMLKPPITKTNVLKMDNNFKGVVKLYDFIISYDKQGYEVKTNSVKIDTFKKDLASEMAECNAMLSFLVYKHGLGLESYLKDSYLKENELRKTEELNQRDKQLKSLKRKLDGSNQSYEEYILLLEKQLRALEGEREKGVALQKTNEILKNNNIKLTEEIASLKNVALGFNEKLKNVETKYVDEINSLTDTHAKQIADIKDAHRESVYKIEENHNKQIEDIKNEFNLEVENYLNSLSQKDLLINNLNEKCANLNEKLDFLNATVLASKLIEGEYQGENHILEDSFNELERQYVAFTKYYKKQWSIAKKDIRRSILNFKNIFKKEVDDKRSEEEKNQTVNIETSNLKESDVNNDKE